MTDVLVPYSPESLGALDGLSVHVWDGQDDENVDPGGATDAGALDRVDENSLPGQDVLDRIEFYVVPYGFAPEAMTLIERMPRLSTVQTLTAGYEHILPHLRDGLTLCNARGVHDASTAELAVTLTLASLRDIPAFARAQETGAWAPSWGESLADKTVLLVGYGAIGRAIEARLRPFECDVLPVARTARDGVAGTDALPDLLGRADVVIVICPLTDETRGMVDESFLASMRDGALLVNVARGAIVRTEALTAEVTSGRLRAALDVTEPEPLPSEHPLWRAPGVLISPHVGGLSSAFAPRARRLVQAQLRRFAAGERLANVVVGPA
ncbi:phosphoglycerate dehydrogenase-like enzyme [Haloactinopolyspora alba]|uniref:Phosphoglycerate dehydrogenase-like enzyme n=1 Tax=Haloactinopolyspora alba TaxID=648780 RepID=A0A2P8E9A3_9ACTN|nr:2-hydroxyacid dehydrogenase [Haloactinopolyspora alba]PSL06063.1 phosphoglycerate dehydrogenase-like enzyme [Haloactinopolyspora alba]